jgi:hypothetical protein
VRRSPSPALRRDRGRVMRLDLVEHRDDAVDVDILVVQTVERAGEPHRVARIIPLIELLAARKGRHCGVEGEAKRFDPRRGIGIRRLEIDPSNSSPVRVPMPCFLSASRGVEFGVVPKDAVLVKGDPAVRREISGDARPGRDPVMEGNDPRVFRLEPRHRAREGVAQTRQHLKERQIWVGKLRTDEMGRPGRIALQHPFEIAEVFGRPRYQEVGGAGARFRALVFVIEAAGYRMMSIVSLVHKIGDRQL